MAEWLGRGLQHLVRRFESGQCLKAQEGPGLFFVLVKSIVMTGEAIVAKLENLQPIEGADRIQQAAIFGELVIVSKDHKAGDIGILFDCETQLSEEFARVNNLHKHSNLNADTSVRGYLDDNRRVRPIRLKGVKCSGLWMPIESIGFCYDNGYPINQQSIPAGLQVGTQFTEWNDHEICKKFVNKKTHLPNNKEGKAKENLVPTFKEHVDTDQFMRNLQHVKPGSILIITEKLHGTSCRVGNLPVEYKTDSWLKKLSSWMCSKFLFKSVNSNKHYRYQQVVGSRRVTKSIGGNAKEGDSYYDSDIWTGSAEIFEGKLEQGETVYYEIVGYLPDGAPIMPSQGNSKLKSFMDKEGYASFIEAYGEKTEFSYNCIVGQHQVYVYRMTFSNLQGHTVDYSWDQVKMRCEQMGVRHVPELARIKS